MLKHFFWPAFGLGLKAKEKRDKEKDKATASSLRPPSRRGARANDQPTQHAYSGLFSLYDPVVAGRFDSRQWPTGSSQRVLMFECNTCSRINSCGDRGTSHTWYFCVMKTVWHDGRRLIVICLLAVLTIHVGCN
jgi:hypothetical protein